MIHFRVLTLRGESFAFVEEETVTVASVKQDLADRLHIAPEGMKLLLFGSELQEASTIFESKV